MKQKFKLVWPNSRMWLQSHVFKAPSIVTQGYFIGEVSYGHQELALVYPSSPPPCSQRLGSSIVRESHWRCVWKKKKKKENLWTCMQVLQLILSIRLVMLALGWSSWSAGMV